MRNNNNINTWKAKTYVMIVKLFIYAPPYLSTYINDISYKLHR